MRLLHTGTLQIEEFIDTSHLNYAILSHRWGNNEVSFQQMREPDVSNRAGYAKIRDACALARRDGYTYIWIDTCCIDKTSSSELSEAINSMFRWYKEAVVCYVHLADVPSATDPWRSESAFERSQWWTRGWTLQELLAPTHVQFYSADWQQFLGSKLDLTTKIADITGISEAYLTGEWPMTEASIARRMSWAASRSTTREEDLAYCLLGIFGVSMPLLYGEGERAFIRLQEELVKYSDDQTLFTWSMPGLNIHRHGPFATHPTAFYQAKDFVPDEMRELDKPYTMTNLGLQIKLHIVERDIYFSGQVAVLACRHNSELQTLVGIQVAFRDTFSFNRVGTFKPVYISRHKLGAAKSGTYYFLHNISINTRSPSTLSPCVRAFLMGTFPMYTSSLSIDRVVPKCAYESGRGLFRFVPESRRISIHFRKNDTDFFCVTLVDPFEPYAELFYYKRVDGIISDVQAMSDGLSVKIGLPRRVVGVGLLCLLDVEVTSRLNKGDVGSSDKEWSSVARLPERDANRSPATPTSSKLRPNIPMDEMFDL